MIDRSLLFSVFDKTKRSFPVFTDNLTKEEASLIAIRSQMTLSMMDEARLETAEAVLPFTSINKIAFILLFQLNYEDQAGSCVGALFYLVPQNQQVFLYNKVPFLKFKAEEIASKIRQGFLFSENKELPQNLKSLLSNWRISDAEASAEIEIIEKKVTLSEKKEGGSIDFFLSQIKKNEERALGALYRGKPIFVTGESNVLVDLIVHSLDYFVPHASLRKVSYTTSIIDPSYADIIGISKNIVKNYPNELIIDIDKKQVRNGKSCPYSKSVIKELRKKSEDSQEIIKKSTNRLLKVASLLIDVFSFPESERDEKIVQIQKEYGSEVIEIAAEIGAQRNPLIKEILLNSVSNRFIDWMDGL